MYHVSTLVWTGPEPRLKRNRPTQSLHPKPRTTPTEVDPVDRPPQQALGPRDVDAEAVVGAVGHDGVHGLAAGLAHLFFWMMGFMVDWWIGGREGRDGCMNGWTARTNRRSTKL